MLSEISLTESYRLRRLDVKIRPTLKPKGSYLLSDGQ